MVMGNVCVVSSLTRHSITKKHGAQLLCNETLCQCQRHGSNKARISPKKGSSHRNIVQQ